MATQTHSPRKTWTLNVDGPYRLTRLSDAAYDRLRPSTIAIEEVSAWDEHHICKAVDMSLGEMYASMKCMFGERGRQFDHWKGAFSFPLALELPRASRKPAYVLNVIDLRGGVEHHFYKIVDRSDRRLKNPIYYPPDRKELPLKKMLYFLEFLVGFQKGYYESVGKETQEPFLLCAESNHLLYGFDGKRFFEKQIDSPEGFQQRRRKLNKHLPTPGFFGR